MTRATTLATLVFTGTDWLWPAILLGALGLALLTAGYRRSRLQGGWKAAAFSLKAAGLLLLALCLLEPTWTGESPKKGANDLAVLADNSRRLAVSVPGAGPSAGESISALVRGEEGVLAPWLESLGETFRLQGYLFDERLRRSEDFSGLDFTGNATALLTSLGSVRARFGQRPLAGILVFTDGNATDSDLLEPVLEQLRAPARGTGKPVPVFPVVAAPRLEGGKDIALGAVTASQSPFEDAPVTITAEVSGRGLAGTEALVIVGDERGEELARAAVSLGEAGDGGTPRVVRVQVPLARPGVSFLQVAAVQSGQEGWWNDLEKARAESGEITWENNRRLVAVDRGRGPYRVLYVGGRPNWEYKFLRRALQADPDVELVSLIRIARREPKFEWRGRSGESSNPLFRGFGADLPEETQRYDQPVLMRLNTRDAEELRDGFPKTAEDLHGSYRAIILDDVEADFFTREQLNLMDRFVATRGGSLLMLGGQESFQPGGWNNTPVGRMLPVYLDRAGSGAAGESVLDLTREGWLEPWARLRTDQREEEIRLAHMPPFFTVNQVPAIKPGASLLATVTDAAQRQHPALVTQRYGEGRTAAFLVGDLWRWGMKDAELREDMDKAWRQMTRWLVADVPDRAEVETRVSREGASPVVRFSARVRDDAFRPQDDASVRLEILAAPGAGPPGPDSGEEPEPASLPTAELFAEPSLEDAGLFEAAYYPPEPGAYRAKVIVRDGEGGLVAEKETGWALDPAADLFQSLEPNLGLLETLAQATGGRVLALSEVRDFARALDGLQSPVTETWTRPLWHAPWVFLLALACLAGEWGIRRYRGVL